MPWAMETKAGFGWAVVITIIFLVSTWAMITYHSPALLLVPIIAFYAGFMGWVNRVK